MVRIPDELECVFSASLDQRGDSYTIEVSRAELEEGMLRSGETYRVAILPKPSQTGATVPRDRAGQAPSSGGVERAAQTPPVEEVLDAFGAVDVLVNNAGLNVDIGFAEMDHQDWDTVIDVHLGGMFRCTDAFFEDIRDAEAGRLINISSIVGKQGNYGQANYATAKSGMFGFIRTLALELAHTDSTANCIAPGFIATDMLESIPEEVRDQLLNDIPLGRFGTAEEVAHLARYLASDESSYVTGEIIDINGGKDL